MVSVVAKPVVFVARVYDDAADPAEHPAYDYSFVILVTDDTATLEGFAPMERQFHVSHAHAIAAELRRVGVKSVRWVRHRRDGTTREIRRRL